MLLPFCIVGALLLVSQGVIQNFSPYTKVKLVEPQTVEKTADNDTKTTEIVKEQIIPQGPVASKEFIKEFGTNGGGFFNANSAHPFENPTPLSNLIELVAIFAIGAGLTYTLGRMTGNQKHGWAVFAAMSILFFAAVFTAYYYGHGVIRCSIVMVLHKLLLSPVPSRNRVVSGNMEGKDVRFGIANSALWATVTTDTSCGAVNSMHDSYTPLGGMVPLINIMLGERVFGGVGAGLIGILIVVIIPVFVAGLMVGRTPEYLSKKIEAKEVRMAMLYELTFAFGILCFSAWASVASYGVSSINNSGPHGLSEIVYAYTEAIGNNGSAFAGLNANTHWYNISIGFATLIGRFLMFIPAMAIAGSLAAKKSVPMSAGTFPVDTTLFVGLLVGVILILVALTFFPVLSLGPVVEHFLMKAGTLF